MKRKIFSKLLMGAFLIASVSMFVSCKDYDDDISKNAQDIAALRAQVESLKSSLASDLAAAKAELATAIANKADKSDLDNKANKSDLDSKADASDLVSLQAKVDALQTKVDAINNWASKDDIESLQTALSVLEGKIPEAYDDTQLKADVEAALKLQSDALDAFKKSVSEAGYLTADDKAAIEKELAEKIQEVKDMIANIDPNAGLEEITKKFNELSEAITKQVNDAIDVMEMLVTKKLTSIVLKPDFYWEGIEGIEVPMLHTAIVKPIKDYTFSYVVTDENGDIKGDSVITVNVDEVMAGVIKNCPEYDYILFETSDGKEKIGTQKVYKPSIWTVLKGDVTPKVPSLDYFAEFDKFWTAHSGACGHGNNPVYLDFVNIIQPAIAHYHINPYRADIEGAKIEFYENDAEVYTRRGTDAIAPTPVDGTYVKENEKPSDPHHSNILADGILNIPFTVNYDKLTSMWTEWTLLNNTNTFVGTEPVWDNDHFGGDPSAFGTNIVGKPSLLPFVAVQLSTADTLVTSDYAIVAPAQLKIIALADRQPEEGLDQGTFVGWDKHTGVVRANHLYESVGYTNDKSDPTNTCEYDFGSYGAIPMPATHSVAWNDTIDLEPFIQTHGQYVTITRYGQSVDDKLLSPADLIALGLHYEFTPIQYIKGKNVTSESMHIRQLGDKTSGKFTPVAVSVGHDNETGVSEHPWGIQDPDNRQSRNTVNREPLVRVDLVDANGNIIRYGYIKLRITDTTQAYNDISVTVKFDDQYMNCGASVRLTWAQMEDIILGNKELSENGITKKEFENLYYMDVEGGYKVMPAQRAQNYADNKTVKTAPDGTLYGPAAAGKWWAKRYYNGQLAVEKSADEATALGKLDKNTNVDNWFGRVWYTPHDNATDPQDWDEQTNVVIWNILEAVEGNMDKAKYQQLMKVAGVDLANPDYKNDGASTKDVSTTIRFINKNNGSSIWLTLVIPATKLHFNYGDVSNKDWAHWYGFNSTTPGVQDDAYPYHKELDAHINPFKPSNNGYNYLTVTSYTQLLTDNWLDPAKMVIMRGAAGKFSKFNTGIQVAFEFIVPVAGKNSQDVSANAAGEWDVLGVSGTKWTLKIGAHNGVANTAIFAVKKDGAPYGPEEICYLDEKLTKNGVDIALNNRIHYHGLETNADLYPAATDLVNTMGAYDAQGNEQFTLGSGLNTMIDGYYLEHNIDRTFTTYLGIAVTHDVCYDPIVTKNFFNVRVHRPINVIGKEYVWDDRVLNDNRLAIKDLVEIVDWNRFPIVAAGSKAINGRNTYTGIDFPKYEDVYANATSMKQQNLGIPYEYYGISELAVRYDEIRTDHAKQPDIRSNKYYTTSDIVAKTDKVKDLNSLTSWRETNLKTLSLINADGSVVPFDVAHAYNHSDLNATGNGTKFGWLYYNNNASVVQLFHIYVPIAVKYNWGNIAYDYILDPAGAKLNKDYTQTVWAIITVEDTHSSH